MTKQISSIVLFVASITLFFASCDSSRVYEEWVDFEEMEWSADSVVTFEITMDDTISSHDLIFGVRNTNMYPYQNVWLILSLEGPRSISYQDTIQFDIAKDDGQWLGHRSASLYTYSVPMFRKLVFYEEGQYTLNVKHGMRQQELNGVASVGFKIEKNTN